MENSRIFLSIFFHQLLRRCKHIQRERTDRQVRDNGRRPSAGGEHPHQVMHFVAFLYFW